MKRANSISVWGLVAISMTWQLFMFPAQGVQNSRPGFIQNIQTLRLHQKPQSFDKVLKHWKKNLSTEDAKFLSELSQIYGQVMIPKTAVKVLDQKLAHYQFEMRDKKDSMVIEHFEEDNQTTLRLTGTYQGKNIQYRIYPEKLTQQEVQQFFKAYDPNFNYYSYLNQVTLLSASQVTQINRNQRQQYFEKLQKVMVSAERVSQSMKMSSSSAGINFLDRLIEKAYAASSSTCVSCVIAGYPGCLEKGGCEPLPTGPKRFNEGCGQGQITCNPLIFGSKQKCFDSKTYGRCTEDDHKGSQFEAVFAFYATSKAANSFDEAKKSIQKSIADIAHLCDIKAAAPKTAGRGGLLPTAQASTLSKPVSIEVLDNLVTEVNLIECQDLKKRLFDLNRFSCSELPENIQSDLKCGSVKAVAAGMVNDTTNWVKENKWPFVFGVGLMALLFAYDSKNSKKNKKVNNKPPEFTVPELPVAPVVPPPSGGGWLPLPGPNPKPQPLPVPIVIPIPQSPATPPVRGVN